MRRSSLLACFGGRGAARVFLDEGASGGIADAEGLELIAQGESLRGGKLAAAAGAHPATGLLYQSAAIEEKNSSEMSATFVIVTWDPKDTNRQGNRVHILQNKGGRGLLTDYWEANPVVLKDHGYSGSTDPVALAEKNGKAQIKKQRGKAVSTAYFHDKTQAARDTWNLVDAGILRMSSIGHRPILGSFINRENMTARSGGEGLLQFQPPNFEITETELVEWSITAVGADRGAMRQALEAGRLNGDRLGDDTKRWLEQFADRPQAYSHGWGPPVVQSFAPQRVELVVSLVDGRPQVAVGTPAPVAGGSVAQAAPAVIIPAPAPVVQKVEAPAPQFDLGALTKAITQGIDLHLAPIKAELPALRQKVDDLNRQVARINGAIP